MYLKEAVSLARRVAPKNTSLPILKNLKLERYNDEFCKLIATDLEVTIVIGVNSDSTPGTPVVFDPKNLKLNNYSNEIDLGGESINGKKLKTFPVSKYPSLPEHGGVEASAQMYINSNIDEFLSVDELRPALTGVYFEIDESNPFVKLTATDGHVLITQKVPCVGSATGKASFIVPKKAFQIMNGYEFTVEYAGDYVIFNTGDFKLYSRKIEGHYPNYESVIPEHKDTLKIQKDHIDHLLDAMELFKTNKKVQEQTKQVVFDIKGGECTILNDIIEHNISYKRSFPVDFKDIKFGVDWRPLKTVVDGLYGDIKFKVGTSTQALRIDTEDSTRLLMPARLS